MNRVTRYMACATIAAGLAAAAWGCVPRNRQTYPSVVGQLPADGEDHELEFWHELAQRPVTTNDDALHGLLLFADGSDPSADYAQRVQAAKDRKWVSSGFSGKPDEPATRGVVAVAIVRIGDVRGGIFRTLFPGSQRYALRELVFQGLYPPSSENQTFSGAEFLGIVGRLEDFQRVQKNPKAATQPAAPPVGGSELVNPAG